MSETASLTDSPPILCLSIPTSLRCANFSKLQSFAILLPSFLELCVALNYIRIVATSRAAKGGSKWKDWRMLLPAETVTFFVLAFVDCIIHVVAVDRSGSGQSTFIWDFRRTDMAVGTLSGLPIILYATFLMVFTASVVTAFLVIPIKSLLIFLIPGIVVLNGFASLAGVTYTSPVPDADPTVLDIGYISDYAFSLSEVFTTSTLSPLTFYQLLSAFFCFFSAKNPDGHLGIGIVLGAVETLIGFGNTGLQNLILRRGMRFFARSCVFVGLTKMRVNANGIGPFTIIESPGRSISRPIPVNPDGSKLSGVARIASIKRPAPIVIEREDMFPPARRSSNYVFPRDNVIAERDDKRSTVGAVEDVDIEKIAGRPLERDSRENMEDVERKLAAMLEQGEKERMETKHGRTKTVSGVLSTWY